MSDSSPKLHTQTLQQDPGLIPVDEECQKREWAYRLLAANTQDNIWSAGLDLKWNYASPSIELFLGFTPAELINRDITATMTPASAGLAKKTLADALTAAKQDNRVLDQLFMLELEFVHRRGSAVWAEVKAFFLRDKAGDPTGIIGVTRNITDHKLAERALQKSEHRYRLLTETISDLVWEVDQFSVYTYVSAKVRSLLGYEPEEVIGKTPFDFMPPEEAHRVAKLFGAIAGCHIPFAAMENTVLHKDGSRIVIETTGVPLFDDNGKFVGYQGCDRDITDHKRMERELQKAKRAANAAMVTSSVPSLSTLEMPLDLLQ